MKKEANYNDRLKKVQVELTKSLETITSLEKMKPVINQKISTGGSKPALSGFLGAYCDVLSVIKSRASEKKRYQIELTEFEIEVTAGIGGYQNNELRLDL